MLVLKLHDFSLRFWWCRKIFNPSSPFSGLPHIWGIRCILAMYKFWFLLLNNEEASPLWAGSGNIDHIWWNPLSWFLSLLSYGSLCFFLFFDVYAFMVIILFYMHLWTNPWSKNIWITECKEHGENNEEYGGREHEEVNIVGWTIVVWIYWWCWTCQHVKGSPI